MIRRLSNTCRHLFKQSAHFLYSFLIEPHSTDEDRKRQEYILNVILVGSIIMLLLLDASVLYYSLREGSQYHDISFAEFSTIPAIFILLHALSRRGHPVASSYLLVGAYFLSNGYAAYHWGVNLQATVLSYALIIMISSILINTRFGFFMTGVTAAFTIPLWSLQLNGYITIQKQNPNLSDAVIFSILYFLIMTVAWLSNREIERSLTRARKSEREVKEQRDLLEIKVDERTHELRKTQFEKIKQLYRFAEFGQLASGLFHDILNIFNTLSLRSELQSETPTDSSRAVAAKTTKQIKHFMQAIRKQLDERETSESFSLVEGIEQALQLITYKAYLEKVDIIFEHAPHDLLMYVGNPFTFHQVIINLVLNAIDSYEKVLRPEKKDRPVIITAKSDERSITIIVKDYGEGISPEIRERIFEPFFTTKPSTKGMGIGLATVKKVIEENFHGTIQVESTLGKGSSFTIVFPLIHA